MNVDRATKVNYRCPQCRRRYQFSFQEFLFGSANCPVCSQEHYEVILNEPTYLLNYRGNPPIMLLTDLNN
ncbi:hypothetical protein ACFLW8_05645 [Chloroflexota bacterium]